MICTVTARIIGYSPGRFDEGDAKVSRGISHVGVLSALCPTPRQILHTRSAHICTVGVTTSRSRMRATNTDAAHGIPTLAAWATRLSRAIPADPVLFGPY